MGFAALNQNLGNLEFETRSSRKAAKRVGEIVSFSMGQLIRDTNKVVDHIDSIRKLTLAGTVLLRNVDEAMTVSEKDILAAGTTLAAMKWAMGRMGRPMFNDRDGLGLMAPAQHVDGLAKTAKTAGDRRTLHRIARRLQEAAENCEAQRVRLHAAALEALPKMTIAVRNSQYHDQIDAVYREALLKAAIKRHPVINEYLAR